MDEDGAETGVRRTLTSTLTGEPDLCPTDTRSWLGHLATTQAAIHMVPNQLQARWDGWYGDGVTLDWLEDRGLCDAAREGTQWERTERTYSFQRAVLIRGGGFLEPVEDLMDYVADATAAPTTRTRGTTAPARAPPDDGADRQGAVRDA